jgi:hypothetical protein
VTPLEAETGKGHIPVTPFLRTYSSLVPLRAFREAVLYFAHNSRPQGETTGLFVHDPSGGLPLWKKEGSEPSGTALNLFGRPVGRIRRTR